MFPGYFASLDYNTQRRYQQNLKIDGEVIPDPYSLGETKWSEDLSKWPNLEFGDLYTYLIDSVGIFTKEKLKAYKSLEAHNYFFNGHVRTVPSHQTTVSSKFVVLTATVNPSQKAADKGHQAWVVLSRSDGSVKTAHCMVGFSQNIFKGLK